MDDEHDTGDTADAEPDIPESVLAWMASAIGAPYWLT